MAQAVLVQVQKGKTIQSTIKGLLWYFVIIASITQLCVGCYLLRPPNYFTKKTVKKARLEQQKLKKKTGLNLTFPKNCVWLKDSCFVDTYETGYFDWMICYIEEHDSIYWVAEQDLSYNNYLSYLDTVYFKESKYLENQSAYEVFLRRVTPGVDRPLITVFGEPVVFVDSLKIKLYKSCLETEIEAAILDSSAIYWNGYFDPTLKINFDFLSIEDYLLILQTYKKMNPKLIVTDTLPQKPSIPRPFIEKVLKKREKINLCNNVSELVLYENKLHVVYKITKEYMYISRFLKPDYYIGFRLKCCVSKRNPVQK